MVSTMHAALSRLRAGEIFRIRDPKGLTLAVFDGLVWVTQDGVRDDTFVGNGGTFTFERSGLALVEALEKTCLAVLTSAAKRGPTALVSNLIEEPSYEKTVCGVTTTPSADAPCR